MKYYIWVLGCQMNKSDAERVAAVLEVIGYKKTEKESEADLIVVLACSVRQSAIDRIYGKVKKWDKLKKKKGLITVLSGCVLPADKPKMEKVFDVIFDIKDLRKLPQILDKLTDSSKQMAKKQDEDYFSVRPKYESSFQAFVPIMTGCNNFCTYCAVPYTKGRERSRPEKEVLSEVRNLISRGYKEITLLGQNVNSYIKTQKSKLKNQNSKIIDFSDLLRKINSIPGKFWIRLLTSNPQDMSDDLIKAVRECEKVCEYIHLPVQAGNDEILRKMNRKYTREHYLKLIEKIRREIPKVAISTDTIVGFPGETKKQFKDTVDLYKKVGFDMAYIAQYSPRPGTVAEKMKDSVSREEKRRRDKELTKILKKTALKNNKKYIGKIVEVLVEETDNKKQITRNRKFLKARTRTYKLVQFKGSKNLIGKFVKVKITLVTPWAMEGEIVK